MANSWVASSMMLFVAWLWAPSCWAGPSADLITSLPGQPNVSFAQYAGYITIDAAAGRSYFYYFVEANDPSSQPLTLWLNGGPGCSSIGNGAFTENGPFRVCSGSGELIDNPFAWNKASNMLFLDSPAGVGWSYSNTTGDLITNDTHTAQDNFLFLQNWFEAFQNTKVESSIFQGRVMQTSHRSLRDSSGPLDVCIDDELTAYMNLPEVQQAFHANTTGVSYRWSYCSEGSLSYDESSEDDSMLPVLSHILEHGVSILVYSGDEDSVIPFGGTRRLIDQLASMNGLKTTIPYSAWFDGGQIGGWTQVYGPLSYATVRGAAHMVPYTSPGRALTLFRSFLAGESSPILSSFGGLLTA